SLRCQPAGEKRGMLLRDTDIEIAAGMRLGEMRKAGTARHCGGDGNDLLIRLCKFGERFADNFRIRRRRRWRSLAALDLVFAETVEFIRLLERRGVSLAFLGENVQQHRLFLRLQKFECPGQQWNIVAVNWAVITQAQLLEDDTRHEQAFDAFLHFVCDVYARFPKNRLDKVASLIVQMRISRIRDDAVQVISYRADVFRDRPLIVVEHDDETLRVRFYIVECFVADPARECGVSRYHDDVLVPTAEVPSNRHAERSGKRRPRMTRAVAVVFTLGAQKKPVESAELAHRIKTIEPTGKHLVDVALMTDIHNESVMRRVKNPVHVNRQFNYPEIWSQMPSGLVKDSDQFFPHLLCELGQILFAHRLYISRRLNPIEQTRGGG